MSRTCWVDVTLLAESDLAWQVDSGDTIEWVPKSQIEDYSEPNPKSGMSLEIEIPEWIALEKGLI